MDNKRKNRSLIDLYLAWPLLLTGLLVLAVFAVWAFSPQAALVLAFFVLLYVAVALWLYLTRKTGFVSGLMEFSIGANAVQSELLRQMPAPYALVDGNGVILWKNQSFADIAQQDSSTSGNLIGMFPNITKEMLLEEDAVLEIHSSFAGRRYCIDLVRTKAAELADGTQEVVDRDTKFVAVYLKDETDEVNLREALADERMVCGLVYIDNYDEVLENIEEVKRSLLTALIDRKINRYISSVDGLVKKLEKDKYFFVMKNQFLDKMLEDRFSILEEVKQVNIGNELAVTLSIGIGYGAASYAGNYDFARTSIDMALGRGGDQAVVKSQEKFSYFGGKAQQLEKTTRVKARVKAHAFRELLESKDKVLIMGHKMGDVDCFGAAIGVFRIASVLGKRAFIVQNEVTASVLPVKERFLHNSDYPEEMFITGDRAMNMVDANTVLVVVDCNRPSITDEPGLLNQCRTVAVFDHHRQSSETIKGAVLSYVEPYASSACEMIAEMMQYIGDGIKVKGPEADAMYAGIVIDTQEFTNQTGVRTFETAAYLRRCGADITRVRKIFRENLTDYQAKARTISAADIYEDAFAISVLTSSKGIESPTVVCAQAANELLNIKGIKASVVLCEYNNIIYISARSIDEMNVQVLMERLGGGGHRTVAGAQLREGTVEEAIAAIKAAIDDMIEEGGVS